MINYIYIALGVFGFTYLLRYLDGPFDILRNFRKLFGLTYIEVLDSPGEEIEEYPDKPLGRFISCFWCLTTWVSIIFCVTFSIINNNAIFDTFVGIFICVGVSGFIHDMIRR
jgi:hypothetical protein